LVLLEILLNPLQTPAEDIDPRKPGTIRMARRLAELATSADRVSNPFLNEGRVAALQARLRSNPPASELSELRFSLGKELLAAGQNEAALKEFRSFHEISLQQGALLPENKINLLLNQALCHLRIAELQNCLHNHNADSCLVPIRGGGIHKVKEPSRNAIEILTNLLTEFPDNLPARWLLNLAAMTVGDYPGKLPAPWLIPPQIFASDYDIKRFVDVAGSAGLAQNDLSGGSVVDDLDNDGFLDVMTTSIGLEDQMHFFRSNGDGTFIDRTREAGLIGLTGGLNMVTADYNNDGHIDLLVLRGAWMRENGKFPNSLLKNNGDGTFEDVTEAAGLLSFHPTQAAAWFDFDGDGWLDLFIGNETLRGEPVHYCELYRNNRDGTFTEMSATAGLRVRAFVKGVAAGDFNNDGRPDLILSAKGRSKMLFRNDGPAEAGKSAAAGWKFTDVASEAGVQFPIHSFPIWFFDYDNDGWEDIYVGGYNIKSFRDIVADYLGLPNEGEKPRLYRNRGNGTFEDVTIRVGLNRVLHAMGSNFGDLDNDGWLDFYLGTGDPDLLTIIPNRMFRNDAGKRFQDVTTSGGFGNLQKGHGVSFADVDNDGDQDVFEEMGGALSSDIYPNVLFLNPGHGGAWLKLQLVGTKANRFAIGARVQINITGPSGARAIHRTVGSGGSFGCNPLRIEAGLGHSVSITSVEILWPGSNTRQKLTGLKPNAFYRITEGSSIPEPVPLKPITFTQSSAHHHDQH
jgi:hypothetical protein